MQLSRRISSLSPSPTVALNAKAAELAKAGHQVLNFAVGEPDFPTPKPIVDKAIAALQAGKTKYGPAGGGVPLRTAIAAKLKRENGFDYPIDRIVCGMGAKEVLFHLFLALLNEGDEVLVPAPYWVSYIDQIKAAGAKPVVVPMPEGYVQGKEAPLRPEDLERLATPRTVGIVLNSPNNPAGYVLSEAQLRAIGEVVVAKGWWVISDEIYEYMAFDHPHVSLLNLFPELQDRFFLVNGLSKSSAMTGWRVGYVAGPAPTMKLVRSLQSHSSTCLPPFIEEAATFALERGRSLLEDGINLLRRRRDLAVECLTGIPGLRVVPPQGAFYAYLDIREALKGSQYPDSLAFAEMLLTEHHLALVPGEAFGTPGFLRLSYAASDEAIREGAARIRRAVTKVSGRA